MENLATIYNLISIVAFIIAGIAFAAAVFMWFKFGILKIIGDLSGRTARKSIEQKRSANEKSGKKSYRPTPNAVERGALTDTIDQNVKLKKEKKKSEKLARTEKPAKTAKTKAKESIAENQTAVLIDDNATTVLETNETEVLNDGTTVLEDGTTVLSPQATNAAKTKTEFVTVQEILLFAADETI